MIPRLNSTFSKANQLAVSNNLFALTNGADAYLVSRRNSGSGRDKVTVNFEFSSSRQGNTGHGNVVLGIQVDRGVFRGRKFGYVYKGHAAIILFPSGSGMLILLYNVKYRDCPHPLEVVTESPHSGIVEREARRKTNDGDD